MLDLEAVAGFEWDDGNSRKSTEKHGVSQAEAEQVFFNKPMLMSEDAKHSEKEPRINALGQTDAGRLLHVTFAARHGGTVIRVISARAMSRRERGIYAKA